MVNILFYFLKEWTGRVQTRFPDWPTDWLLTFSLGVRQCALYLYIYVFCDFCIDVSAKKRKKWKVIADPNTTINSQMLHLL